MILVLSLGACLDGDAPTIAEVVRLELERPVVLQPAAVAATSPRVAVACDGAVLHLRYAEGATRRSRDLALDNVSEKARARTVALAIVELLETPEPEPEPEPTPATVNRKPPAPPPPDSARVRLSSRASLAALASGRFFPAHSDFSAGARLRSRLLAWPRTALVLGVGVERGRAARAPGNVQLTVVFADLGLSRDVARFGPLALAAELVVEGGFIGLTGSPSSDAKTKGEQLTSAWSAVQLGFAPRVRLASNIEVTTRAGIGWMLWAPAATSDGQALDVWSGLSLSVGLGLSVAL